MSQSAKTIAFPAENRPVDRGKPPMSPARWALSRGGLIRAAGGAITEHDYPPDSALARWFAWGWRTQGGRNVSRETMKHCDIAPNRDGDGRGRTTAGNRGEWSALECEAIRQASVGDWQPPVYWIADLLGRPYAAVRAKKSRLAAAGDLVPVGWDDAAGRAA